VYANHRLGIGVCGREGIISVVMRIELVADRISYVIYSSEVRAPAEHKNDDKKDMLQ
jgi:hypothetical protein